LGIFPTSLIGLRPDHTTVRFQTQNGISRLKADELSRLAIWINERWASLLEEGSKEQIVEAKDKLKFIVDYLDKIADNNLSARQPKKLVDAAVRIRDVFWQEQAKFLAKID
jgi:hypothetical protein